MSNLKQQIKESPRLVQDELIRLNNRMRELEAKIAELEAENKCLVASCKATVNCKADAIREMLKEHFKKYKKGIGVNLLIETREILEYADNLEKSDG